MLHFALFVFTESVSYMLPGNSSAYQIWKEDSL